VANAAKPSRGPILWLMAIIGALGVGALILWTQDTRQGTSQPLYSVARTDDVGAAVVYRLFEKAGFKPQVWDQPLTRLSEPGVLILLAPASEGAGMMGMGGSDGDLLPDEIVALDEWVKKGGVAVILSRDSNDLYKSVGLIVDEPKGLSAQAAEATQPGLLADGVTELKTHTQFGFKYGRKNPKNPITGEEMETGEPPIPEIHANQWLELFVKKQDQRSVPQVVTAARGKGLYVAVNDVFPATNLGVTQGDNARFMLNIPRLGPAGGTVWFDEHHKRSVDRGFITYVRERALLPALVYGLLLLLLGCWRFGVRFGAPDPLTPDRRRDSGEYIKAAAALYQNAGMSRDAAATIFADFRRRMSGALRMDKLTDLDEVGRRYEMRTGRPAIEARQCLIETEAALSRSSLTEAEALQVCARLTHLDHLLHAPKRTRKPGDPRALHE
jgi:hypothetical protein